MAPRLSVCGALAVFALVFVGAALATSPGAQRSISGIQLLPGSVGTDTSRKGSAAKQTTARACLLALAKPGEIRIVTGIWQRTGVTRWSFGWSIPTSKPFAANVRLLSDGRVTKIYRR